MSKTYHKIQTLFKREENAGRGCPVIEGDWSKPEFEYLKNIEWTMTEKVDGTNVRIIWDGEKVLTRGKKDTSQMPVFLFEKLQEMFTPEKLGKTFIQHEGVNPTFTLYGEGYGRRIQKGGTYLPNDVSFILFDVYFEGGDQSFWMTREACEGIAKSLEIDIVPIVHIGSLDDAVNMCKYGFTSQLRKEPPEGLILKPKIELNDRRGNRIISKLKLSDFPKNK